MSKQLNSDNRTGTTNLQPRTKSLLEELQAMGEAKDKSHVIESRASSIITSAINLIESLHKSFPPEKAELLEKRLLSAIKNKDTSKFSRSLKKK